MTKRTIALAAAGMLGWTILTAQHAQATPIYVGYSFTQATSAADITTLGMSAPGGTLAVATGNTTGNDYQILVTSSDQSGAAGFSLYTFNISTKSSTGPGTIYIYTTETNITPDLGVFVSGFGVDSLSAAGAVETSFAGSNAAYTLDNQLATYTLVPGSGAPTYVTVAPPGLPEPFAVTQEFQITFARAGQTFIGSQTLQNILPEPMSLAALGAGLIALGYTRRSRRAG